MVESAFDQGCVVAFELRRGVFVVGVALFQVGDLGVAAFDPPCGVRLMGVGCLVVAMSSRQVPFCVLVAEDHP